MMAARHGPLSPAWAVSARRSPSIATRCEPLSRSGRAGRMSRPTMGRPGLRSPARAITRFRLRPTAALAGASARRAASEDSRDNGGAMKNALLLIIALSTSAPAFAQGTPADYDRALNLRKKYESLVGSVA